MALACVVLHNICIERGNLLSYLSYDFPDNKRRDREAIRDLLDLTDARQKKFELGRTAAMGVRRTITDYFWDEKQGSEE